ncbi:MAG: V-type proton ATPase subunit E [Candidatus Micrarchaeota archaeon]|nr:V-type proton ATPase subunit E [Candidatus Micrarchaeota archaeon]
MGFEELAAEIERNAEAESKKIINTAQKNAEKIVEAAQKSAEESIKKAKAEIAAVVKQENAERATSARLSAKKIISEAKEDAVEASLEEVWKEFKAQATRKGTYQQLLSRLIEEGIRELGTRDVVVLVRDEDRHLVAGYRLAKLPDEYSGGAIIESANGKIRVNKTLEEMFAKKKDTLRKAIYEKLF